MSKKVTIKDVAKKLNVTTSTVSRALNDHHSISEKTKKLVRKTAEELNYSPNKVAASLRSGKGNSIGVIIPKINSNFMSNCVFGIEGVTYPSGYNLIICQSNENFEKEVDNIRTLIDSQVSGILMSFSNSTHNSKHLKLILDKNIPIVLFDRVDMSADIDCVVNDDYQISKDSINHLIQNGYKKIAFLGGPTNLSVYRDRLKGYREGLLISSLELKESWIFESIKTRQEAHSITLDLFENKNDYPDAIFCTGDVLALGAIEALKKLDIDVPKQVGVIGYSNHKFADIINPSLTSIEQFPQEIGGNAAKILIDIIENKNTNHIKKSVLIKSKLIVRDSSNK